MPSRRDVLATLGVGSLGAFAGCLGDDEIDGSWHRAGYDNRNSGYAPQHRGPGSNSTVKWSAYVPEGYNDSSPVLVDNEVYIGYANDEHNRDSAKVGLRILDSETGKTKDDFVVTTHDGRNDVNRTLYRDSVVFSDGSLYIQAFDGIHSLTSDGKKRWHVPMDGGPVNSIQRTAHSVVVDGFVYAPTASITRHTNANESLYAIDDATGEVNWQYTVPVKKYGWTFPPAYADGTVYLAALNFGVVALDSERGTVKWRTRLRAYGPPTVDDGRVYVSAEPDGGKASLVVALDAETGEEKWESRDEGTWFGRRIAAAHGRVYQSESLNRFVARDAATGEKIWHYDSAAQVNLGTPAVTDDAVYVGVARHEHRSNGVVVLEPTTGEQLGFGDLETEAGSYASISLSNDRAFLTTSYGRVHALEPCGFDLAGHCLN